MIQNHEYCSTDEYGSILQHIKQYMLVCLKMSKLFTFVMSHIFLYPVLTCWSVLCETQTLATFSFLSLEGRYIALCLQVGCRSHWTWGRFWMLGLKSPGKQGFQVTQQRPQRQVALLLPFCLVLFLTLDFKNFYWWKKLVIIKKKKNEIQTIAAYGHDFAPQLSLSVLGWVGEE